MNQDTGQMQMTAEQAKAALGNATFLQDQIMPKAMPEAPEAPDKPSLREQYQESPKEEEKEDQDLEEIKSEIKELRQLIKESINEDGQDTTTETD